MSFYVMVGLHDPQPVGPFDGPTDADAFVTEVDEYLTEQDLGVWIFDSEETETPDSFRGRIR